MVRFAACVALLALVSFSLALPAAADEAADLYKTDCAKCHGADGKADTPVARALKVPPLVGSKWLTASPDEFLAHVRTNPKHKMPMKKLNDDQLRALQVYARGFSAAK